MKKRTGIIKAKEKLQQNQRNLKVKVAFLASLKVEQKKRPDEQMTNDICTMFREKLKISSSPSAQNEEKAMKVSQQCKEASKN